MRSLVVAGFLVWGLIAPPASLVESQPKPPKDVVEEFWTFETNGGRLTADGWNKASEFFVRPSPRPDNREMSVVYKDSVVSDAIIKGSTAEVTVEILPQGQIDSSLRFTQSSSYKAGVLYHLTLTDRHWELGVKGGTREELTGPPKWRIEDVSTTVWLRVDTALRYVRDMRKKSTRSVIKKNADHTIAELMKLH